MKEILKQLEQYKPIYDKVGIGMENSFWLGDYIKLNINIDDYIVIKESDTEYLIQKYTDKQLGGTKIFDCTIKKSRNSNDRRNMVVKVVKGILFL